MLDQISPDIPSTPESPSKPLSFKRATKKLPWTVFALVLLVHLGILWWLMGAYFGRPQENLPEPIFVTLEAGEDLPGEASTLPDASETVKAEAVKSVPPDVSKAETKPVDKSVDIPVDITVEKSAKPPVALAVPVKRAPESKPQEKPAKVLPERSFEQSAVSPAAAGQGQGDSAGQSMSANGTSAASDMPRTVSRVEYLGAAPSPVYPAVSRSRKQQGLVIVRVLISTTGTIETIRVLQTSGFDALDTAAINAFANIQFKPYAENGIPFKRLVDIPIEFSLRN
jgi:protein TonB